MKNLKDELNVVIQVGDTFGERKWFEANTHILQERSVYFCAALSNKWATKQGDKYFFQKPNISPRIFETLLRYIYNDGIDLHSFCPLDCLNLLIAADEMIFEELVDDIQTYFIKNKSLWVDKIIIEVLNVVTPRPACMRLNNFCFEEIIQRDADIIFRSPNFKLLHEMTLASILMYDGLSIREIDIWRGLLKWGQANSPLSRKHEDFAKVVSEKNNDYYYLLLKQTLSRLLPFVRFFNIPEDDFIQFVRPFEMILPENLANEYFRIHKFLSTTVHELFPLRFPPMKIDSTIIKPKHASLIASWIDGNTKIESDCIPQTFELLYRSSRDGISAKKFHAKCDKAGPTILLVKLRDSEQILGGYNPITNGFKRAWFTSSRGNETGFVFSFSSEKFIEGAKLSRIVNHLCDLGVQDHPLNGPCFGTGPDLWVNISASGGQKIGQSVRQTYAEKIFGTQGFFSWVELEVFEVIDPRAKDD
ncbi:12874_t:CDS:2 [Ambispora gerdemannii]|uniref:12874_t:CDS:1 n=1 Tax=Ambispora gerdemannii TaxID=144530 RepID=A0A9N9BN56_9GLOM|nr:12874_t:CDS:2 [Ambispora gerdemannii]